MQFSKPSYVNDMENEASFGGESRYKGMIRHDSIRKTRREERREIEWF